MGGDQCCVYLNTSTDNDGYSGDRYSGNDGYSGLNPPDDAILFTVSGITAIADKYLEILMKMIDFLIYFLEGKSRNFEIFLVRHKKFQIANQIKDL